VCVIRFGGFERTTLWMPDGRTPRSGDVRPRHPQSRKRFSRGNLPAGFSVGLVIRKQVPAAVLSANEKEKKFHRLLSPPALNKTCRQNQQRIGSLEGAPFAKFEEDSRKIRSSSPVGEKGDAHLPAPAHSASSRKPYICVPRSRKKWAKNSSAPEPILEISPAPQPGPPVAEIRYHPGPLPMKEGKRK